MMTPTRIVRFFGFIGTTAFLGLAATSTATIQAKDGDQPPPPPPIAKPAPPPIPTAPTLPEVKPVVGSLPTIEEIRSEAPLIEEPAPEVKPAPKVEEIKPVPVDAPEVNPAPAPAPKVEEIKPVPVDPSKVEKITELPTTTPEPEPIAEAAPPRARNVGSAAASLSEDPDAQARSFMERSRKEAEGQLKALNAEAAQLRSRLTRIESGIRRWQALVDAMDRSEQELPDRLEALPRARPSAAAARRSNPRQPSTVIQSTPEASGRPQFVAGPDGVFRPVAPAADADPVTRAQFVPAPTPR